VVLDKEILPLLLELFATHHLIVKKCMSPLWQCGVVGNGGARPLKHGSKFKSKSKTRLLSESDSGLRPLRVLKTTRSVPFSVYTFHGPVTEQHGSGSVWRCVSCSESSDVGDLA
jgi:hypothetical protein